MADAEMKMAEQFLSQAPKAVQDMSGFALSRYLSAAKAAFDDLRRDRDALLSRLEAVQREAESLRRAREENMSKKESEMNMSSEHVKEIDERLTSLEEAVRFLTAELHALRTGEGKIATSRFAEATPEEVMETVCEVMGVTEEAMKSKKRTKALADARRVYWIVLAAACPWLSVKEIARSINRDHSTVSIGIQRALRNEKVVSVATHVAAKLGIPATEFDRVAREVSKGKSNA